VLEQTDARSGPAATPPDNARVQAVAARLVDALGADAVSTSVVSLRAYARDAYPLAIRDVVAGGTRFAPEIVVWPTSVPEVAAVIAIATAEGASVVPYGGGSGIVGGALGGPRAIILDTKRLAEIEVIDTVAGTVTVGAGCLGKDLEDRLNAAGHTCGHYPQSLYSSTVGGWVAHRGVGTFSTRYGKMDDLVVALDAVLPDGTLFQAKAAPQSAAGPDLKRLFLGAEGTLGVVTRVTLKIFPLPEVRLATAYQCSSFDAGLEIARRAVQRGYQPAAVRLYDAIEARERLGASSENSDEALLLVICEGPRELAEVTARGVAGFASELGARDLGPALADHWLATRFSTAGLVSTISSERGVADALEVANDWRRLPDTYRAMLAAMSTAVGDRGLVYGHASHFYHSGANLYMIFHVTAAAGESVDARYRAVLDAAFDACFATGATLTHHHGVGIGKRKYMRAELGEGGLRILDQIRATLDPNGVMNPGKLTEGAA
jgi:alkyldihydroxyacetonephosphate synthase